MDLINAKGEKGDAKLTGMRRLQHQIHNFFDFAAQHQPEQLKAWGYTYVPALKAIK
jgi:hypothetical protein